MNENEKDGNVLHHVMVYEDEDCEYISETECRFCIDLYHELENEKINDCMNTILYGMGK